MSASIDPKLGVNSWLEDELYQQYLHDRRTVDESWKEVFESDGHTVNGHENGTPAAPVVSDPTVQAQPAPAPAPLRRRLLRRPEKNWFRSAAPLPGSPRT